MLRTSVTDKTPDLDIFSKGADWENLLSMAMSHSLYGVMFIGIKKLPKKHLPQDAELIKWYGYANIWPDVTRSFVLNVFSLQNYW